MGNPLTIGLLLIILSCTLPIVPATPPRDFYEDQIAEESMNYDEYYPSFALPKIFNDGKPFIVAKDPVTGTIDFNTKKTVFSSTPTNFNNVKDVETKKQSADINQIAPNIHDFLNLPVKYSSAKSVYPLISSSYSNLKYQGNNKHFVSNHKNFTTSTTVAPKYYTNIVRATSVKNPEPTIVASVKPASTTEKLSTTTTTGSVPKLTEPPTTTGTPVKVTTYRTHEITTFKYETKYKYQDSAAMRKKINITTTAKPIKQQNSFGIGTKLNVIPLNSTKTPTKTPSKTPSTYPTKPQYSPTVPAVTKTTSVRTTVIANVETEKDTSFVRFPSDKSPVASSRPFATRITEPTTTTPVPTTKRAITTRATKKVPSLSDLFSLWSDNDDYYDENREDNTVVPDLSLTYKDVPVSLLPSNYSEKSTSTTSRPVTHTTTTSTTSTTPIPTTTFKVIETTLSTKETNPTTVSSTHQTLAPQSSSQQNIIAKKPDESDSSSSFFQPQVDLPMYQDPEHKVMKRPGTQEMLKMDLPELLPQLPTVAPRPVSGFQGFNEAQQQQQQEQHDFQAAGQGSFPFNQPADSYPPPDRIFSQGSFFPPVQNRPVPTAQQNQQNYVNYGGLGGAPIKNTFVISPSQDSASFVLGSQSMVGSSDDGQQSQSQGHFVGSAIEEPLFDSKLPRKPENLPQGFSLKVQPQQDPQARPVIRFPNVVPDEVTNEIGSFEGTQIVRGTINDNNRDQVADESIASPFKQNQINFPASDGKMTPQQMNQELSKVSGGEERFPGAGQVAFRDEVRPEPIRPPSQDLTPPGDGQYEAPQFFDRPGPNQPFIYGRPPLQTGPPPQNHHARPNQRHDQRPQLSHFHRLPLHDRPHQNKLMPRPQYRIDHVPMPTKTHRNQDRLMINDRPEANMPVADRNLPNILPQFRPNVKGYQKPIKDNKNYRPDGPKMQQNLRRPPPPQPSFIMRRPNGPNQFISRISNPYYEEQNQNRRHYNPAQPLQMERLPFPQHMTPPQRYLDPKHPVFQRHLKVNTNPLMLAPLHAAASLPSREQELLNRNEENVQTFREELNQRNQAFSDQPEPSREPPKLEPVVTLHQLQAKKLLLREKEKNVELPKLKETVPEVPVTVETENQSQKNVYVVYPIKGQEGDDAASVESKIVIASRGEHGSKVTPISTGSEYQNTPFSVVAHFEQEPLLPEKTKPVKSQNFPYSLEKPEVNERVPNNHKGIGQTIYNTGEQPGQVISSTLTRVTTPGAPIAIAYTPTPQPANHKPPVIYDAHHHEVFSLPNIGSQVIPEIRDGPQTESSFYNDYDGSDRVKENFQAPFYASANLPSKVTAANVFEGWAIATPPPPPFQAHYDNNNIDRSDNDVTETVTKVAVQAPVQAPLVEVTTKKFDPNSFKPEFLSGFQPILSTQTVKAPQSVVGDKLEPAPRDGSTFELSTEHLLTDNSSISSTTTKNNDTKKEPKKPFRPFDSLEAFFDALTRDYTDSDPDYEQSTSKSS